MIRAAVAGADKVEAVERHLTQRGLTS